MAILPPGISLDREAQKRVSYLISLFQGARRRLDEIERQLRSGSYSKKYYRELIREAQETIDRLVAVRDGKATGEVVDWARQNFPASYQAGMKYAVRDISLQGVSATLGNSRIHNTAVSALFNRYVSDVTEIAISMNARVIESSRILLASTGLAEDIASGIIGGLPRRQTSRLLAERIRTSLSAKVGDEVPEGMLTHIRRGKRDIAIDDWAAMHARTETARAVSTGTRTTTVQNGALHIQVTSHAHEPCICTPFEGRIYRLYKDRGDMRFPHVSIMPNGGVPLHPNCVHREAPAIIEFLEERGDVEGRTKVPDGIGDMSERELARWVRQNRDRLGRYSRRRDGVLPENFRVRQAVAA